MTPQELRKRTEAFAAGVLRVTRRVLQSAEHHDMARQARRAATSAAANYRAACLARSRREFAARLAIVLEEADETSYWLPMLRDAPSVIPKDLEALIAEAGQLTKIFGASLRTVRASITQ